MSYKTNRSKQIVLVFVALPLVLVLVVFALIAIRQRLFEQKYLFYTNLQNAVGLSDQTPVLYKGFEIGRVSGFHLTETGIIKVEMKVLKRYRTIMVANSVIFRTTNPIMNKTTLEYLRGPKEEKPLADGAFIPSTDFATGRGIMQALGQAGSDPIGGILDNVGTLASELTGSPQDKGSLIQTMENIAKASEHAEALMESTTITLHEISKLMENLNEDNSANSGVLVRTIHSLAALTENLNQQMGTVSALLSSSQTLMQNYAHPDSLIVRMLDPSGETIMAPLKSILEALAANLEASHNLLQGFNAASPQIASLLGGLDDSLADAQRSLRLLNNHPLFNMGAQGTEYEPAMPLDRMGELPHAQ